VDVLSEIVGKAGITERQRLERVLSQQEAAVRSAFLEFLADVRSPAVLREVRRLLEASNVGGALRIVDSHVLRLGSVVPRLYQSVGSQALIALSAILRPDAAGRALNFDQTAALAVEMMRRNQLEFVGDMTRSQREATRQALVEAQARGWGTERTARAFRDSIGLTQTQRAAVANYRRLLELGDRTALDRLLRDRRFDSSVERSIEEGVPLGGERIQRMVEAYERRMRQSRAETIARTEGLRATGQAQRLALLQAIDGLGISPQRVVRVWRSTLDNRTRDTHSAMDGQRRGLEEPFVSPSGARLMYPGDSSAPASEVINCRCVVQTQILSV
jgi:hypothetical protein